MKLLQIGAGSMGMRRLRDLSKRSDVTLAVFDKREDRRDRAEQTFSIPAFDHIEATLASGPDAIVISTPPDQHNEFIEYALENGFHHFCEEHIWTYDFEKIEKVSQSSLAN